MVKCNTKTLIVLYRSFNVGGIETNMADMMQNAFDKGCRVIWISNRDKKYSPTYSYIFENPRCEIIPINYSSINPYNIPKLYLEPTEEIWITAFDIKQLFFAYKLRKKNSGNKIHILYMVPLFTGSSILLEESFQGYVRKIIKNYTKSIYETIDKNGNLYFFSRTFYKAIQENYGIEFISPENKLTPEFRKRTPFELLECKNRYNSDTFTIISAGRFDFPHKGYLLGLIQSFAKLRERYSNLRLLIIGDGDGKSQVLSLLSRQSTFVQDSITLKAPVTTTELEGLMRKCNLNISVAGCATLGARVGLPTLPARHYYSKCEVYGLFPDSRKMTTERKPGFPVEDYIEKVIQMSEDEYINLCKETYNCFDDSNIDPEYPFNIFDNTSYIPKAFDFWKVASIYCLQRIQYQLKKYFKK